MKIEAQDEVMTLDELALYLKLSRFTVYKLVQEGRIPGQKLGKQWRFSCLAIDQWLKGTSNNSNSALASAKVDMNPHQIQAASIEFKAIKFDGTRPKDPNKDKMAHEIAAFANGQGGRLVLGVDDKTRDVIGLTDECVAITEDWIVNISQQNINNSDPNAGQKKV